MSFARGTWSVCILLLSLPAATLHGQEAVMFDVGIDHIILAVPNLTRGMDAFTRLTGVVPKRGGQHPGRGTENALVSLGWDDYLELLAPVTAASDSSSLAGPDSTMLQLAGWAIHTRALDHLIGRLRAAGYSVSDPTPGSRRTPDGLLLQWRTAAVSEPRLANAPFFIEWGPGTPHPSGTSPSGCRLVGVEFVQPDSTHLSAFFQAVGYRPTLRTGRGPGMRVVLDCPRGRVSFSP
jgi:hypothetical protein